MVKKCPNQTMPINLPRGVNTQCKEKCNLTYFYGISKVTCTNKKDKIGSYLEINCFDSPKNDVSFGLVGDMTINSVKLFRPSLNKYNGEPADAEIILTHTGGGRNVFICIPIVSSTSRGNSAKWFHQIIPFAPTRKEGTVPIETYHFTLNHLIPRSSFVVYEGGVFCWGGGKDDISIIYEMENAAHINPSDLNTLKSLIEKNSYNTYPNSDFLQYSVEGSRAGPGKTSGSGKSKQLQCVPIYDRNGEKIPEGASDVNPSTRGSGLSSAMSDASDKAMKTLTKNVKVVIIICAVLLFLFLLWLLFKFLRKRGGSSSAPATPASSSGTTT